MLIKSPIMVYDENKAYVVGIHLEHLTEVLQMSTHNICFVFMKEKEKCYVDSHFIWSCGIHTGLLIYRIRPNYRTVRLGFSELLGTLSCAKI